MSRGTRQETLIRSLIEGLCLTLEKHYQGQTRQKPKLQAVAAIQANIEELWKAYPLSLARREAVRVVSVLMWFKDTQEVDPDFSRPEVVISMVLALADRLKVVTREGKKAMMGRLNRKIQALYDTFDRQVAKTDMLIKGAEFADKILAREI
jgi:hypothetical protein